MPQAATWTIAVGTTLGVVARLFGWPEAVWAVAGAFLLLLTRVSGRGETLQFGGKGTDVYLFLAGMMLLAETARRQHRCTGSHRGLGVGPRLGPTHSRRWSSNSASVGGVASSARQPVGHRAGISWGVLPLVAGFFVIVSTLEKTGLTASIRQLLEVTDRRHPSASLWGVGALVAALTNLVNNLPAGLLAGNAVAHADVSDHLRSAVLVGIDLGPNLSVTGSLATILWLGALRREGVRVSAMAFLRVGFWVMTPALLLALAVLSVAR